MQGLNRYNCLINCPDVLLDESQLFLEDNLLGTASLTGEIGVPVILQWFHVVRVVDDFKCKVLIKQWSIVAIANVLDVLVTVLIEISERIHV